MAQVRPFGMPPMIHSGGRLDLPTLAIVNDSDRPCRRLVAEWIHGIGYCYMSRDEDDHLKRYDGMLPTAPTSIEAFGFRVILGDKLATFSKAGDSTATYKDGRPRKWDGIFEDFMLPLVNGVRKRGNAHARRLERGAAEATYAL